MGLQNTSGLPHGRPRYPQGGDQPSARDVAAVFGAVFGARAEYPLEVSVRADGMVFRLLSYLVSTWDVHGYRMKPGNVITIRKRTIRIHQIANTPIIEQDIHLAGTVCWVYASLPRPSYTPVTILTAAIEPASDAGALNIPLYCFALSLTTNLYSLTDSARFDVNIDAPSR